jgi:prolipoprotein diacylglyceryltransferase
VTVAASRPPRLRIGPLHAFQACVLAGCAVGAVLLGALGANRGLPIWTPAAVLAGAVLGFFALAMATKVASGRESLTLYHHAAATLLVTAVLATLVGMPRLLVLDVTATGLAAGLACGRVGCLLVGCCHGRPAAHGIRYPAGHAAAGFPPHLVGVNLVPVQALEALWLAGVASGGAWLVAGGAEPGTGLTWCVSAYAAGRFLLEPLRGDEPRHLRWGLSPAQLTAAGLGIVAVPLGAWAGWWPAVAWQLSIAVVLGLGTAALAARHRALGTQVRFTGPVMTRELAQALAAVAAGAGAAEGQVAIARTSLGVHLSASGAEPPAVRARYGLSVEGEPLTSAGARSLTRLIGHLAHPGCALEVIPGSNGVHHVVVRDDQAFLTPPAGSCQPSAVPTRERLPTPLAIEERAAGAGIRTPDHRFGRTLGLIGAAGTRLSRQIGPRTRL